MYETLNELMLIQLTMSMGVIAINVFGGYVIIVQILKICSASDAMDKIEHQMSAMRRFSRK